MSESINNHLWTPLETGMMNIDLMNQSLLGLARIILSLLFGDYIYSLVWADSFVVSQVSSLNLIFLSLCSYIADSSLPTTRHIWFSLKLFSSTSNSLEPSKHHKPHPRIRIRMLTLKNVAKSSTTKSKNAPIVILIHYHYSLFLSSSSTTHNININKNPFLPSSWLVLVAHLDPLLSD